jgi:gliding motility-associated-like protein
MKTYGSFRHLSIGLLCWVISGMGLFSQVNVSLSFNTDFTWKAVSATPNGGFLSVGGSNAWMLNSFNAAARPNAIAGSWAIQSQADDQYSLYFNGTLLGAGTYNPAPVANAATNITCNSFMAHWDTVVHCLVVSPVFNLCIPNSFTPNGDGLNDQFMAYGRGIKTLDVFIYSRWGQKVYHFSDIEKGWPENMQAGNSCPMGVYVYKINAVDFTHNVHEFVGHG